MTFHNTFEKLASELFWNDFQEFYSQIDISILRKRETPFLWRSHCHPDPFSGIGKDWANASILPTVNFQDQNSFLPEGFYFLTKLEPLMKGSQPCHQDAGWMATFTSGEWQAIAISEIKQIQDFFTTDLDPEIWTEFPVSEEISEINSHYLIYKNEDSFVIAEIPLNQEWGLLIQEIFEEYSKNKNERDTLPKFEEVAGFTWVTTEDPILESALSEDMQDNAIVNTALAYSEYWKVINEKIRTNQENEFNFIAPSKKVMLFMENFLSKAEKQTYVNNLAKFAPEESWSEIEDFFETSIQISKNNTTNKIEKPKQEDEFFLSNSVEIQGPFSLDLILSGINEKEIPEDALISDDQINWKTISEDGRFSLYFPKENIQNLVDNIENKTRDKTRRKSSSTFSVSSNSENSLPDFSDQDLEKYKEKETKNSEKENLQAKLLIDPINIQEPLIREKEKTEPKITQKETPIKKQTIENIPSSIKNYKIDISSPIPIGNLTSEAQANLDEIEKFNVPLMWSFSGKKDVSQEMLYQQMFFDEQLNK